MFTFDERIVSDLHKEAYGFRPNQDFYMQWALSSDEEKQLIWDNLCDRMDLVRAEEHERELQAVEDFEKRIAECLKHGATDRKQAVKWIVDGLELSECDKWYGGSYVCYLLGLPYSFKFEFEDMVKHVD